MLKGAKKQPYVACIRENVYFCKKNITLCLRLVRFTWYGEYKVTVGIRDGVVTGKMPGRALRMVLEWLDLHRDELISNWEKAQNGTPLDKIEPLN